MNESMVKISNLDASQENINKIKFTYEIILTKACPLTQNNMDTL